MSVTDSEQKALQIRLQRFNPLSEAEFSLFLEACTFYKFDKGEFLLQSGTYNRGLFFLLSGSVGLFEIVNGKEIYHNLFLPGDFAHEVQSLISEKHSSKSLVALAPTRAFFLERKKLLALYEQSISFEKLGRKLLEHILAEQSRFTQVLQSLKPDERYVYVMENRADLLQAIPLTVLASYLGMARETLSRIRARQ